MIDKLEKSLCTGCTSCASVCPKKCITLQVNRDGFIYPLTNYDECVHCNICEKSCPILTPLQTSHNTKVFAAMNTNEEARFESSSGGLFTLLAEYVINQGGYVVGATYDENFVVKHTIINNKNDIYKLRGAKYSQSNLSDVFKQVKKLLNKNVYVLFSGTPCQVGGLIGYLQKNYEKLITVDFICHGVPSPMVWNQYLNYRNKENIKSINLRSKITGWSNYNYSVVFDYGDKKYSIINYEDVFMKAFVGNYCLRESCSNCKFKGIERVSDFTLGDYWGVWEQHPELDDNKGTSLVFIHNENVMNIFNIIKYKTCNLEVDFNEAIKMNPSMLISSVANERREEFLDDIYTNGFTDQTEEKYFSIQKHKRSIISKIKNKIKSVIKGQIA